MRQGDVVRLKQLLPDRGFGGRKRSKTQTGYKAGYIQAVASRNGGFYWCACRKLNPGFPVTVYVLEGCACRKLNPGILVMQSAQGWATKNVPGAIDGARDRCIFLQG